MRTSVLSAAAVAFALACTADGPTEPPPDLTVVSITLSLPSLTLSYAGQTHLLRATPKNAAGESLSTPVTWSSSDRAVAEVDQAGEVTAISNGPATISATIGTVTASIAVTVDCTGTFCQFFLSNSVTPNIVYGVDSASHRMNVFQPLLDTREARPLVILFAGSGLNVTGLGATASALARYGFVVATARYRTPTASTPEEFFSAIIRGQQDLRAAVRYFKTEAAMWKVDTARILIGGNGTGGIIAALRAYATEDEVPATFASLLPGLGGLEGDQGNPAASSEAAGALLLAGGIYEVSSTPTTVDAGEYPLFAVHAADDAEISIDCTNAGGGTWECGGRALVERATSEGLLAAGAYLESGGHNAPRDNPSAWINSFMVWARALMD